MRHVLALLVGLVLLGAIVAFGPVLIVGGVVGMLAWIIGTGVLDEVSKRRRERRHREYLRAYPYGRSGVEIRSRGGTGGA